MFPECLNRSTLALRPMRPRRLFHHQTYHLRMAFFLGRVRPHPTPFFLPELRNLVVLLWIIDPWIIRKLSRPHLKALRCLMQGIHDQQHPGRQTPVEAGHAVAPMGEDQTHGTRMVTLGRRVP